MFAASKTKGVSAVAANYIEDVFSTWLYTGNGSTQTINNGIDLAGKGGLVWIKDRTATRSNVLFDTLRGATYRLISNTTAAQNNEITALGGFNSTGFSTGYKPEVNESGETYVSWTFRKAPKFFDVVTYTGDGAASRTISHNLQSKPGFVVVKRTDSTGDWWTLARKSDSGDTRTYSFGIRLNLTNAQNFDFSYTGDTSTSFPITSAGTGLNVSGATYVAYFFAHNAGGFGLTGTDNVISCGSYTSTGTTQNITLGYEPQWLLLKKTSGAGGGWFLLDTMRGQANGGPTAILQPDSANAEVSTTYPWPTATGFTDPGDFNNGDNVIYIAIRRGPMKVPTDATKVFAPITSSGSTGTVLTTNFPVDMLFTKYRSGAAYNPIVDRLRGVSSNSTEQGAVVYTTSTGAESGTAGESLAWNNTGFQIPSNWGGLSNVFEAFRRAPSFFDEVCYTGTGSATTFNHNLGVAPEMMWVKRRNTTGTWRVYASGLTSAAYALTLNSTAAESSLPTVWNSTAPTSSVFSVGTSTDSNASGSTYVAYLFATCPGVSKVGSYTGNGTTQTINCGFTGGARFVLIKIKDSTGNWYVYDTARGMTVLTDPYLLLNSTAAESATLGSVITTSVGFIVDASILAAINTNGASYIYFAIA